MWRHDFTVLWISTVFTVFTDAAVPDGLVDAEQQEFGESPRQV